MGVHYGQRPLLTNFPGAAAAYSLRSLSNDFLRSPVVRVRRSSDNAERDFTSFEINDGSLVSWVGVTASDDGLVTTWYDQSGNGNDATQATASNQPKIVDAGILVKENNKPAIDFDGVDDNLRASTSYDFGTKDNFLLSFVGVLSGTNFARHIEIGSGQSTMEIGFRDDLQFFYSFGAAIFYSKNLPDYGLFSGEMTPSGVYLYEDGQQKVSGVRDVLAENFSIISIGVGEHEGNYADIRASEILIYDSNGFINRLNIEKNINNYYNIY